MSNGLWLVLNLIPKKIYFRVIFESGESAIMAIAFFILIDSNMAIGEVTGHPVNW